MGWGWGYGMMGGWFGMLLPLLFMAVVIYTVIKLAGGNHINHGKRFDTSLDILNERFAKGEITEEEYKHKKVLITQR